MLSWIINFSSPSVWWYLVFSYATSILNFINRVSYNFEMLLITDLFGLIATTSVIPLLSILKASLRSLSHIPMTTLSHFNSSFNIFLIFQNNKLISLNSCFMYENLFIVSSVFSTFFSLKIAFHPLFGSQVAKFSFFDLFVSGIPKQLHY